MTAVAKNGNKWLHIIAKNGNKKIDLLLYWELQSLFCHFWQYFASKSVTMLIINCHKWQFLLTSKLPKMVNEHTWSPCHMMSHDTMQCHMSHDTMQCHMTPCNVTWCHMTPCNVTWCHMTPCNVTGCHMTPCNVTGCHMTPCNATWCHMTSHGNLVIVSTMQYFIFRNLVSRGRCMQLNPPCTLEGRSMIPCQV